MSRLQVGGLALIIKGINTHENVGKVVELRKHYPSTITMQGNSLIDAWDCYCESGLVDVSGRVRDVACFESHRLIPLGDKQGQDEIMKEKELEYLK